MSWQGRIRGSQSALLIMKHQCPSLISKDRLGAGEGPWSGPLSLAWVRSRVVRTAVGALEWGRGGGWLGWRSLEERATVDLGEGLEFSGCGRCRVAGFEKTTKRWGVGAHRAAWGQQRWARPVGPAHLEGASLPGPALRARGPGAVSSGRSPGVRLQVWTKQSPLSLLSLGMQRIHLRVC